MVSRHRANVLRHAWPATSLANILRDSELLNPAIFFNLFMIGAAILDLALKAKVCIEIGITLGIAAVDLLLFLRMSLPFEHGQLFEYSILAAFNHRAILEHSAKFASPARRRF